MSAGWRGSAGQVRRNFRQLSPHRTTGNFFHSCPPTGQLDFFFHSCPPTGPLDFFFTVVGLDDNLDIFFLGRIPTLARARQEASMPGRWRGRGGFNVRRNCWIRRQFRFFFLGRIPTLARARLEASMPGRWRAREAMPGAAGTKPPNPHSPPRPCYTCYMCYMGLTRQATEHPLSAGSLLFVLFVLPGIEACVLFT